MSLNIEELLDLIPGEADFDFRAKKQDYHYFCHLEIKGPNPLTLDASSNALKTALDTLVEKLKSRPPAGLLRKTAD